MWHTLEYATTKEECTLESKSCLESVSAPTPALVRNYVRVDNLGGIHRTGYLGYIRYNFIMTLAIMTMMYTSKCANMDFQQLPDSSKFHSRCKKCDIEKTVGGGYHPPFGSQTVNIGSL